MAYATQADLEAAFGAAELIQLADRDRDGLPDAEVIAAALGRADSVLDGYLAVGYDLPLSPVPAVLTATACDLARYWLYDDAAPERIRELYDDAMSWLKDVAAGKVRLVLAAPETTPWPGVSASANPAFTGQVEAAAGAALSPSLTFTGDTNTGLYSAGANEIGLTANGALVMTLKTTGANLASGKILSIAGTPVVGARATGWAAATGTATRTTFATSTVTLEELAQRVKGLIDDLIGHGLIGT